MRRFVIGAAAIAALGGLLFGYDTGVISGAILFIAKTFTLSTQMQGFVVSIVLIGAIAGAAAGGALADRFGRRVTLLAAGVTFALGAIVSALAPHVAVLLAGRLIVGAAIGVTSVTSPLYISEVSPPEIRGGLVSLYQFAITIGIVCAFATDYAFANAAAWQWMLGIAIVPSVLLISGMLVMPESPRFLFKAGKDELARSVLSKMRVGENNVEEEAAIRQALQQKHEGFRALATPDVKCALFVGAGLAVLQQITGINTVIYYGPQIFAMAGFASESSSILATAIVGVVNVLLTVVAIVFTDRIGRKPLLYAGCIGMGIALIALSAAFSVPALAGARGGIALLSLMVYVGSFAFSLGPIVWLIISEIYPLKARGLGMSIATLSNWAANFVVSLVFLPMIQTLGRELTFLTYAVMCAVTIFFVRYVVPETRREELESIDVRRLVITRTNVLVVGLSGPPGERELDQRVDRGQATADHGTDGHF